MILDQFDDPIPQNSDSNSSWALLSSYDFAFDSELLMLTEALTEAEINNHTMDKSGGAINPMLSGNNGHVQLYVDKNKWKEAQQILKNQRVTSNEVFDSSNKDFHRPTWIYVVVFILLAFFLVQNFQKLIYIIHSIF
jgi:hypothetical protein